MDFTVIPPSPQVSLANSQQAIADEVTRDGAKHLQYKENQRLTWYSPAQEYYSTKVNKFVRVDANPVFSDKQSTASGAYMTTVRAGQLSDAEAGAAAGDLVYVYYVHDLAPQTQAPGFQTTWG
ncbi:unnamed protein product [Schistocephalus solidus]|uniref:DM13 domain-containing protein n=1 Tax=Schistocephalus solidus TaxID=70667 RepID=A0A183S9I9_SCHSO|nr:unnamed protein product [Schistocephalus solidus]